MGGGPGGADAGMGGRRFVNTKSQVYFLDPDGMNIGWQTGTGPNGERTYLGTQLVVPGRYNFNQGYIYRLKLTNIKGRPGMTLYPTIEVAPTTPQTDAYLAHNAIPVQFTAEDFDQVIDGGNFVTKVIYLPDPKYQELAVAGVETLVSTRLEPGVDPVLEADKRGTILLIVRVGAIDLEMQKAAVGAVARVDRLSGGAVLGQPSSGPIPGIPIVPAPDAPPAIGPPRCSGERGTPGQPAAWRDPVRAAPAPAAESVPVDTKPAPGARPPRSRATAPAPPPPAPAPNPAGTCGPSSEPSGRRKL